MTLLIHHLALRVADPARSASFYSELLGLPVLRRHEADGRVRAVWLAAGGVVLMLERSLAGPGAPAGSAHLLAFAVDDLSTWETRLASAGVPVAGRSAHTLYFQDPDGHRLGVSSLSFETPRAGAAAASST